MNTILIKNGIIVTLGENNKVLRGHALLIEGNKIKKIAPEAEFTGKYDKVIDAHGRVVMPGFINAHMHYYSTFSRGLCKAKPSTNFLEVLDNLWWRLDKKLTLEDTYYSALIPMIEAVKHGTTTMIDHHASPYHILGSLHEIEKASNLVGLRNSLCYEVSDRDGEQRAEEGLKENYEFAKYASRLNNNSIKALFGLHASFTVSDKTLGKAVEMAKDAGVGFHVHVAEGLADVEKCQAEHGCRVIERFHKAGVLGNKTIAAHCVHINEHEMDLVKETDTAIVQNPESNANNAIGTGDMVKIAAKGILLGMGTDAMTVRMTNSLRMAVWMQHLTHDPSQGFMEPVNALAFNNAKIANRYFEGIGVLKEGYMADIVIMDYLAPSPFDENNFAGHLVFGMSDAIADTTIADGKVLMENKVLKLNFDVEEAYAKSAELAAKLWERF